MKQLLEGRIDLSAQFVEFHEKGVQLAEQLDSLEDSLRNQESSQQVLQVLDDHWANMQHSYSDLKSMGHSFISEATKVGIRSKTT